jgi:hypothetical protein
VVVEKNVRLTERFFNNRNKNFSAPLGGGLWKIFWGTGESGNLEVN